MLRTSLIVIALATLLCACATDATVPGPIDDGNASAEDGVTPQETADADEQPVRWECGEPRPTRCPTATAPVCGNGASTYRNECYACRDGAVAWYTDGACA